MRLVGQNTAVFQGTDKEKIVENLKFLLDGLLKNQDMMMNIIAFVAVLLIVNIIRRLPVDYAWQIAIFTGAISYVVIMVAGGLFGDVGSQMFPLIAGTIGSVILAVIMEFFLFHVDYTRIEYLEYEDDDYCYYVKAVPKMSIAGKEVKVTTFQETEQEMPIHMTEVPMTEVQPMDVPPLEEPVVQNVDYESQLEESLRNL